MSKSQNFDTIIKKYKLPKLKNKKRTKEEFSHTDIGFPYGTYFVPDDCIEEFNAAYEQARLNGKKLHLVERPKNISPLCIDVDLRFKSIYDKRVYKLKHIKCVVDYANKLLNKYIAVDKKKIQAFVTEKQKPISRTHVQQKNNHHHN